MYAPKALALLGCLLGASPLPAVQQTVILVRHAERADTTPDSPLSLIGEKRAQALAETLADAGVTRIYTTAYRRTRDTAAPLAERLRISPTVVEVPGEAQATARAMLDSIRAGPDPGVVLVVGHSNTIPFLIRELGGVGPELGDTDYGDLFIVTVRSGSPTETIRARFGDREALALRGAGAGPSGTEIYLASVTTSGGALRVGQPMNITRRTGYDNQPSFAPDGGSILYTSIRSDSQADTYRYRIAAGSSEAVTRTSESEYSPTYLPQGGGFSVVRVEADSTQRLWRFSLDGTNPRLVIEEVKPVGYYAWGDEHTVVLYVLGEPATLHLADLTSGEVRLVASDVGRSLHRVPHRHAVSFLHHTSGEEWWIEELDLSSGTTRPLVRALGGSQDYTWLPEGGILMAQGTTIYRWPRTGTVWNEVTDVAPEGVGKITRLAVAPKGDWLAFVADESPAP